MSSNEKKGFSKRLITAMLQHPEAAKQGTKWGVSSGALQNKADVSREMSRRYLEGQAIPRPDTMKTICGWLNVRVAWLQYGEEPMRPPTATGVNEEQTQYTASSDKETKLLATFRDLPDPQQDIILALLDSMTWGQQKRPFAEPPFPRKKQDSDSKGSAKAPKRAQG